MASSKYRQLEVWQKARELARDIYRATRDFPRYEIYGIVSQLRRATVSVASNIAEGHGRDSDRERLHFLSIARGSLFELETQILIALELEYVTEETANTLDRQILEVIRLLNGLIRHYKAKAPPR